ncbi:MAG: hypothetical protein HS111_33535 [Kofleriaceae bacterium]|nr:hypothetical protein [Kofleriaceae bacterium]
MASALSDGAARGHPRTSRSRHLVVDNARAQALTRAWDRYDDPSIAAVDVYRWSPPPTSMLVAVHLHSGR